MGFLDLFVVALMPVLKLLLVTALGLYLALDHVDVMGEATRKQLNRVSYFIFPSMKVDYSVLLTKIRLDDVHYQLVYLVFNPALVGSNLAKTVTLESVLLLWVSFPYSMMNTWQLTFIDGENLFLILFPERAFVSTDNRWFMPINILLTFIIGSTMGWILVKVTGAPQHLKGLILGCCAAGKFSFASNPTFFKLDFEIKRKVTEKNKIIHSSSSFGWIQTGNMGNLPLIIVPAVCREEGSPFGEPDVCHTYGMAYASLSMAVGLQCTHSNLLHHFILCDEWLILLVLQVGAIYKWSYLYNIVRVSSSEVCTEVKTGVSTESVQECNRPLLTPEKDASYEVMLPLTSSEESWQVAFHLLVLDNPYLWYSVMFISAWVSWKHRM